MTASEGGTVLIVDDDREVARTYRHYLKWTYDIREAYDGESALDELDDDDIDIVLLDQVMPDISGREMLDRIRDRGCDVRIAMVTAVDPDFDIVGMGLDDYLTRPTTREELLRTIEGLLAIDRHAVDVRERHALPEKATTLRARDTVAGDADG
ncbi:MAG: response regulator transcription factor [Haloplanus sp.]